MEESKRTLFFNAPGFRNQEVEVAPDIEPMKSKRKPLIDQEVCHLRFACHFLSNDHSLLYFQLLGC